MREIKFRAWDKETKEMCRVTRLMWDTTVFRKLTHVSCNGVQMFHNATTYELMQSTGLKDKNGKEIYEGDIFKITVPPCESNQVVFDDGEYKLVDHGLRLSDYTPHGEVIGNIYENPELLETK